MVHDSNSKGRNTNIRSRALRWLPLVLVPFTVGALEAKAGFDGLPLMVIASLLGCAIPIALPEPRLAIFVSFAVTFLLVAFSYIQALQELESSSMHEAHPRGRQLRLGARDHIEVSKSDGKVVLDTLSIVLPCAMEGEFAYKTVDSIWAHTRHNRIKEIIIVDDGSQPPLRNEIPERLLKGGPGNVPLKIIRHSKTRGLIGAKKTGGDAAVGDVIVFLDCHVKPRDGWEEAFLTQMKRKGDHRTVVVPTITALNIDTWEEIPNAPSSVACYMMWSADFTWLSNPGRDVPIMSGGLLALSRQWWIETGGLDDRMVAWGGENIDQSLRAWLCGGRIEVADGAYIAHMWRDAKNPKTRLKYPIPTEDVMRNKARAVSAWLGPFVNKTFRFPEYEWFVSGAMSIGDMSHFDKLKKEKHCKPFSAYIQRFSYVYLDSGLTPKEVFQLRESLTGWCLERRPRGEMPHKVVLAPCAGDKSSGGASELQLWHPGNRDHKLPGKGCCSGLMNWNFLQCLDAGALGMRVQTMECVIAGESINQAFSVESSGQLAWRRGEACLGPEIPKVADADHRTIGTCTATVEAVGTETAVSGSKKVPSQFKLIGNAGEKRVCATPASSSDGQGGLQFVKCDEKDAQQIFSASPLLGSFQIKAGETGNCLDAAGGGQLLVYPCYEPSAANTNQAWEIREDKLLWDQPGRQGYCVDVGRVASEAAPASGIFLKPCAPKVGQRLTRSDHRSDGSFLFYDKDLDRCLGSSPSDPSQLAMVDCNYNDAQRWKWLKDREQVQHISSSSCIDTANSDQPILYACHTPRAQRTQRFQIIDSIGLIQTFGGWDDNGRKRYFERCLDHHPLEDIEVSLQKCDTTKKRGVHFSRIGIRSTPEYELWQKVEKPAPDELPLGGDKVIP